MRSGNPQGGELERALVVTEHLQFIDEETELQKIT